MQLKWTDLAGADLDKIEAYIARENSPSVAIDVVLKVIDTAHLILPEHPGAGRLGRLKGTRELVIDGLPFILVYRHHSPLNQLQILRVLHDAQQWPTAD
ncbi:type II toxin-antitoxin system RelE/ParE family toxin [Marinimicrobium sp. ABcell2]|uniref:type II toxin-antitoxin system RelE/ParE family toxin n=1 Tax=Marinimicrobium sp. ABcell2 TaxID=3069751 RepID=UPI0027B213EE|nr:type II toxin-antitoxin system RelE/ParE family toxin [Marinimicrobium sp. ABcell2]MDQ2077784.1 type II toxin-antitoxin system RelE/ParE family toxin [Marinimicrobium sp. ABcell2]